MQVSFKWTLYETPSFRGVWGPSPRNFLASVVANCAFQCHFGSLHSNTPTPSPSKIISLQIYTDLKNGPESWKKVWNQTKVWKFWSLSVVIFPSRKLFAKFLNIFCTETQIFPDLQYQATVPDMTLISFNRVIFFPLKMTLYKQTYGQWGAKKLHKFHHCHVWIL